MFWQKELESQTFGKKMKRFSEPTFKKAGKGVKTAEHGLAQSQTEAWGDSVQTDLGSHSQEPADELSEVMLP